MEVCGLGFGEGRRDWSEGESDVLWYYSRPGESIWSYPWVMVQGEKMCDVSFK